MMIILSTISPKTRW